MGRPQLAAHLIELAAAADPDNAEVQRVRADVYATYVSAEPSLIGKGILAYSQRESDERSRS